MGILVQSDTAADKVFHFTCTRDSKICGSLTRIIMRATLTLVQPHRLSSPSVRVAAILSLGMILAARTWAASTYSHLLMIKCYHTPTADNLVILDGVVRKPPSA